MMRVTVPVCMAGAVGVGGFHLVSLYPANSVYLRAALISAGCTTSPALLPQALRS